jgi:UDP-2-acetamido-2,6-beta-L-arabino-hexul-4-ose reductase
MGTDSAIQENEIPARKVSLGELAGCIQAFHDMRLSLSIPDFSEPFMRALYATYLSYVPVEELESRVQDRSDERGSLAEFIKSERIGQVFVSRTRPGVTRGNHYHHTKAERFLVVEGEASIRMRSVNEAEIIEYRVCGNEFKAVDIPPWFTHCITNIGSSEMVTLFWADEIFNPNLPDTYYLPVETTPFSSARDRTDTPILMTASDIRSSETL